MSLVPGHLLVTLLYGSTRTVKARSLARTSFDGLLAFTVTLVHSKGAAFWL
jgi:hypothetical protein